MIATACAQPSSADTSRKVDLVQELSSGFANHVIRRKARQLVGKARLTPSDRDDIEQQLRIDLLERFQHFDPQRSHWAAFVLAVIDRRVASILESLRRQKRKHREKLVSLSVLVPGEEGIPTELGETLLPRHQDFLVSRGPHDDQELFALQEDVQTILRRLPKEMRRLCQLRQTKSVSQIAKHLGVPRSTVAYKFRKLANIFAQHGLEKYLTPDW